RTFPAGYREVFTTRSAVYDIAKIEELREGSDLAMTFYRPANAEGGMLRFKLYRFDQTIPLSDALPMLENMGLRVLSEQPYEIFLEGRSVWINDFHMYYPYSDDINAEEIKDRFQQAFYNVWKGNVGNDSFNRLVLSAGLSWRQVGILRSYAKYFRQTGVAFSQEYLAQAVNNNPKMANRLVDLFHARFAPRGHPEREKDVEVIIAEIEAQLDEVASLDEDRIIRRYVATIMATLRTNYFQRDDQGKEKYYIAYKLNPAKIPGLPLPLPALETFVYSPTFEGVHLRSSKVARGGIRWSDRREDFRTEVLGLMKAQQVKNAVIVPSGAKGGFVCKKLPTDGSREDILAEGIRCYKGFIHGLLDVVDNIKGAKTVTPKNTVRYDDVDPYLVVAADKGTASFSDIANSISKEYDLWLGDAFASGGSVGYDHKKIGITARGAWESVKCHFREMGIDPYETEFTALGIGDMSGDVFGNGLLMTDKVKLVAAFNHMHIFLDPTPDAKASYSERIRLYNTPRSSWADYDPTLISKGGGVFKRSAKAIKLSPEVRKLLDIKQEVMVPNDLIRAILAAPVDLIWNGGIGTYVKSTKESHDDVGDRTNDNVRVNANKLRAKVVAEGGNLGFTQLARV
ncbi:MAG: NAD-glutamate dehydrogenase, partial [Coxiellaceae bacterium]|nr:NAD-glutamate dehydrogenase [Coxiellaceae bacterium]